MTKKMTMRRTEMHLDDLQVRIFNGRGWVCPLQYSMTSFKEPNFAELHSFYQFRFDFQEVRSGTTILDNVPELWETWVREGKGTDPLGANFRKNFGMVVVTQDEVWSPNCYQRTGIFNKKLGNNNGFTNFQIKTETTTSHVENAVFMKVQIFNKSADPLELQFLPHHLKLRKDKPIVKTHSFTDLQLDDEVFLKLACSGLKQNDEGWLWKIPGNQDHEAIFKFVFSRKQITASLKAENFEKELLSAKKNTEKRLAYFLDKLPAFKSENLLVENLYYKSITTLNECLWKREDFVTNPFWSVGSWIFTIAWDSCFSANILTMLDAKSIQEAIWLPFTAGKMMKSYVSWQTNQGYPKDSIFYIQEPIAIMSLLQTYLKQTRNFKILSEKREGKTLLEWMKEYTVIFEKYLTKKDLFDIGESTELVIEVRTDGYNHIVPLINILIADYYLKLGKLCQREKDKDDERFIDLAHRVQTAVDENLWDEKNNWFQNMYPDGSKMNIWVYHLFDVLESELLSYEKKLKLLSHVNEGEFLGKYGFYSLSKRDTTHFDRIDADWGGGGQFAGMPGKIAKNAYKLGSANTGYEIIQKLARWTEVFPYQPQNARTEQPFIDLSSMAIQLSSGSSMEAIIFGIFGIELTDNEILINPKYNERLGISELTNIHLGGHTFDIYLEKCEYFVKQKNGPEKNCFYGVQTKFIRKDLVK